MNSGFSAVTASNSLKITQIPADAAEARRVVVVVGVGFGLCDNNVKHFIHAKIKQLGNESTITLDYPRLFFK